MYNPFLEQELGSSVDIETSPSATEPAGLEVGAATAETAQVFVNLFSFMSFV